MGDIEQAESFVSGAGVSTVTVTFRETATISQPGSTALSQTGVSEGNKKTLASTVAAANRAVTTGKAEYTKFKASMKSKVAFITDAIDGVQNLLGDVAEEVTALTNDIYSALDEGVEMITVLAQVGTLVETVSSVPGNVAGMAQAMGDMTENIVSSYNKDSATATTYQERINLCYAAQSVVDSACASVALGAVNATYQTREEVSAAIDEVVASYASALSCLEYMAGFTGSGIKAFAPDHDSASYLHGVIFDTIQFLLNRAFSLKVGRTYILTAPSDALTETWTRYGDIEKLDFFIMTNRLTSGEFAEIPAGRHLVQYG